MRNASNFFTFLFCALFALTSYYVFRPQPSFQDRPAPQCAAIHDVGLKPFGDQDSNGTVEHLAHDGFHDVYLHTKKQNAKVALREEWGGALVFFGQDQNLLAASSAEHALQVALHDDDRAYQSCASTESCLRKNLPPACTPQNEFMGWNPVQATDRLKAKNRLDGLTEDGGLVATVRLLQFNPRWQSAECNPPDETGKSQWANVRLTQSVRFIKDEILEVEYQLTNLENHEITANLGPRHELPRLFADLSLNQVTHGVLDEAEQKRQPASTERLVRYLRAKDGWLSLHSADQGLGIYWENRSGTATLDQIPGEQILLKSNTPFVLGEMADVRARFYLLLGEPSQVETLAQTLDRELPPFGRIEDTQIALDTRHVHLTGWVLDNKKVQKIELWVDNQKTADVALSETREDVCRTYPGYSMCKGPKRVGFDVDFDRPTGGPCPKPIEIRATDDDGNTRIVARKSVLPVPMTAH